MKTGIEAPTRCPFTPSPVPGGIAGCKTASPQWIDPWFSEAFLRRLPCCLAGSKRSKLLGTDRVQKPCAANQEATPVL